MDILITFLIICVIIIEIANGEWINRRDEAITQWMKEQEIINSVYSNVAERLEYLEAEVRRLTTRNTRVNKTLKPRVIQKVPTVTKKDNDGI